MANDDRFTGIVVLLATLITAGGFLWSHWESWCRSIPTRPLSVVAAPVAPVTAQSRDQVSEPEVAVPAVLEKGPGETRANRRAAKRVSDQATETLKILESLAGGWTGSNIPPADKILVCRNRDGRMIVAPGTHRRYTGLRKQILDLDLEDTAIVLAELQARSPEKARVFAAKLISSIHDILAIDLPKVEPDMVAGIHAWHFADPQYRSLGKLQQHMLLMGRKNAGAIRNKLEILGRYLGELPETGKSSIGSEGILMAGSLQSKDPVEQMMNP